MEVAGGPVHELLHHVAHDFDATRHFLISQSHPVVWWGNIVAGVVVFVVVDICWQLFLKKWVKRGLAKIHAEELKKHAEREAEARKVENDALHRKLNHLIKHSPDVPPLGKAKS